jgi:transposase
MKSESHLKADLRFQRRKDAVDAVLRGESPTEVAQLLDIPLRTMFDWLARYRQGGYDALREGGRSGRPRKVTGKIMRWLYEAITSGDPQQYQFPFCLWTLAIVRTLLKREHGIELSKSGVSRLLRHLGLSPQRPIYRSYKQDPKELDKYLSRTFPELRKLAKRTGAAIYFVDEASVRSDAHRGTTWGKIGETPVVMDSGDRFGLKLISAVSPRGDMKFATFEGKMTGPRFVQFLKNLRSDTGGPIIVIVDKASYHRSGPVKQYVEASGGDVVVEHLPCYAPEYNPDEQVWNHAKARLAKLFIITKDELFREMRAIMQSIQRTPKLIRSFFQLEHTRYAADAL